MPTIPTATLRVQVLRQLTRSENSFHAGESPKLSDDDRSRREELWQILANLLPAIQLLWLRTWAGFSDAMPRHGPAIDRARQVTNLLS